MATAQMKVTDASELDGAIRNQGAIKLDPLNGAKVLITRISDQVSQYGSSIMTVTLMHDVAEVGDEGEEVEVWASKNMQRVIRGHFATKQTPVMTILAKDPRIPSGQVVRGWQMLPGNVEFAYEPDGRLNVTGTVQVAAGSEKADKLPF